MEKLASLLGCIGVVMVILMVSLIIFTGYTLIHGSVKESKTIINPKINIIIDGEAIDTIYIYEF
jgi:hypothetical protein